MLREAKENNLQAKEKCSTEKGNVKNNSMTILEEKNVICEIKLHWIS